MADEDYWNQSDQVGFDFGETDEWAICSTGINKLSAEVKKTAAFEDLDLLHCGGFDEFAENENLPLESLEAPLTSYITTPTTDTRKSDCLGLNLKEPVAGIGKAMPQRTVMNMILSLPYNLEQHKGKEEKIALLDIAINSHDGNAITTVILFLKKTLKKSTFQQLLLERMDAINHYLHYLQTDHEDDELGNMLLMLGRTEEAAVLKFKRAISVCSPESKIKRLQNCLDTHFYGNPVVTFFSDLVTEYIILLQHQLPVEANDSKQEMEGTNEIFRKFPRSASLIDSSVITTLFYCCLYHYHLPENNLASPNSVRKWHQLTDKQFVWTAVSALSICQRWSDIETLFQSKSWLGGMKMKCCIGFHKAVEILAERKAPVQIIDKYVRMIENAEDRLNVSKKYKCHQVVVETLIQMKDRQGLLSYKKELLHHSVEFLHLEEALLSSNVKWKN